MNDKLLNELSCLLNDKIIQAETIAAGQNETARIELANGEQYFAKYTSQSQVNFEQTILEILSAYKINGFDFPKLHNTLRPQSGNKCFLVTSFIQSHPVTTELLLAHFSELIDALVALHKLPHDTFSQLDVIWPLNLIASEALQISLFEKSQHDAATLVINNYQQALEFIRDNEQSTLLAVNHGDLSVDNLLFSDHKFALIDWEYAKVTDVRWDLATIAVEFQLSSQMYQQLCQQYAVKRSLSVVSFIEVAMKWRDIYRFISLHWAINYNQPIEKYLIQT
ncbi:MAG: aminoglycoside phosphotransferase family protein [Gammaproteobacteria bacterium]|nr:aminoglycoside phosphotransferase family protein [Gammaproteobacteria bacterium]